MTSCDPEILPKKYVCYERKQSKTKVEHSLSQYDECGKKKTDNNTLNENLVDYLTGLPAELFQMILWRCDMSSLLSLSETCNMCNYNCLSYNKKWKRLCAEDFDAHLTRHGKFKSYQDIYRLLYCSRILLGSYIYARYYNKMKLKNVPSWLLVWSALSWQSPMMKFGRHRIKRRINGSYLRRLHDLSHGQIKKVFHMESYGDLMNLYPTRIQRGTIYFSWQTIRYAGVRKYGDIEKFDTFLLNKCYRARGFIERNYVRIKGTDPLQPL